MKKLLFILSVFVLLQFSVKSQGLQPGECGIMFTYDATGSLTQREFICNNTGVVINRLSKGDKAKSDSIGLKAQIPSLVEEIVKVDAIMPNPTTGYFTIKLAAPLKNSKVILLDGNGKPLEIKVVNGTEISFDIGNRPGGIYFVRIESIVNPINFKIIKQ